MSFLYRSALIITRKHAYVEWANGLEDGGPRLTAELVADRRTVYLIPEFDTTPSLSVVLDECWEQVFEEELAMWVDDEDSWPKPRTRQLFDSWFDAALTLSVVDLAPDEPLTQSDIDVADLHDAMMHCAWCEIEVEPEAGRLIGLTLPDRDRFAHRQGLVLPVLIRNDRIVTGIMTLETSQEAANGEDLIFRACPSRCEKLIRKTVPKALKRVSPDCYIPHVQNACAEIDLLTPV